VVITGRLAGDRGAACGGPTFLAQVILRALTTDARVSSDRTPQVESWRPTVSTRRPSSRSPTGSWPAPAGEHRWQELVSEDVFVERVAGSA
jgi:hypothetical protein